MALIADAGHMLTDAAALLLAWVGFRIGRRASDARRTFGYLRFEVLAGLVNAITLFALVAWIAWEAVQRLRSPGEVLAGPMLAVAVVGLLVNCLVFWILHRGDQAHVNIRGATLHVLGDLLGSGTISGPEREQTGALLEMTGGGKVPVTVNGAPRTFIEDGDEIGLFAQARGEGYRIGFGPCTGQVLPALP